MEKIHLHVKKVFESKVFFRALVVLGVILVTSIIFCAGVTVGFHKASFGRSWGEHYNENFGMGRRYFNIPVGMGKIGMMDYFPNAHGATGKVIKVALPNIIVQDRDKTEKVVLLGSETAIQKTRTTISEKDIHVDDFVVVIGTPDDKGVIEAKLIRVFPAPEFLK